MRGPVPLKAGPGRRGSRSGGGPHALRRTTEALHYGVPVLVLAGATALSLVGLPALQDESESRVVAAAVALDFTVAAPGLVFLLLVRTRRVPWTVIVPTFVIGYALAVATIPRRHQDIVETMRLAAIPAELALVAYVVLLTRKALAGARAGSDDAATRFRWTARRVLGSRVPADILTTEIMILYYAFRWRRPPPPGARSFTLHREAGYLSVLIGLGMALLVETVALHLLVRQWSGIAAAILTGLSLYALIWLVGDYRAIAARPIRIEPTHLAIRLGLRWEADIPIDRIAGAEILRSHRAKPARDTLVLALLSQPNLLVRLDAPVEVTGMYGLRRTAGELWLRVDGAEKLCAELCQGAAGPR